MKTLFITSYYLPAIEWGGPAICVPAMAEGLRRLGVDVTVLTTNGRGRPALPSIPPGLREVNAVPVHYFNRVGPPRYFFSFGMTKYLAKSIRSYDLVHIHGLWTFPVLISSRFCQLHKKPYLITLHGQLVEWAISRKRLKKRFYMSIFEANTIANAELLHFTSEFERRNAIDPYSEFKSVVIPNPVDAGKFLHIRPLSEAPGSDGKLIFLIVGRLHPIKGFDLLIPALSRVRDVCDFELVVVGPDEDGYLSSIMDMVDSLSLVDDVKYLGLLKDESLVRAYERSHVVVVPSYQENFGLSAAEGMASARPVMVSGRVGIADVVAQHKAGWVFEPTVGALADSIRHVCDNTQVLNETGLNGREAVLENFTSEVVARRLLDAYEGILRDRQPSQVVRLL